VDFWNRLSDKSGPWEPHRGIWQQISHCRDDTRSDVRVLWARGHVPMRVAAGRGRDAQLRAVGNREAHRLAQAAARMHPDHSAVATASARAEQLAERLGRYYSRLLELLMDSGGLPAPEPLSVLFRLPRPPPLPAHILVEDSCGKERCVRCLLPSELARGKCCRPAGTLGHSLVCTESCVACVRCGAYAMQAVKLLGGPCGGRLKDAGRGSGWRLRRILSGRHPRTGAFLGQPRRLDPAEEMFTIVLG
jgi:hypothetical protein